MTKFPPTTKSTSVDPTAREKALSAVYRTILSWPDPREKKTEPVTNDLGGEAVADPEVVSPTQPELEEKNNEEEEALL